MEEVTKKMEDAFKKLKEQNQNNVDNLVKWMKDSKLIDQTKEAEENAKKLFADIKNQSDVEFVQFQKVVASIAKEQQRSVEDLTRMLSEEGPRIIESLKVGLTSAMEAGVSAFRDAMKK